jgi:hypothetical protein
MVELYLEGVRNPTIRTALGTMATTNAHATTQLHHAAGITTDTDTTGLLDACLLGVLLSRLALPPDTPGLADTDTTGTRLFDTIVNPTNPPARDTIACRPLPRAAHRRQPVAYGHGR